MTGDRVERAIEAMKAGQFVLVTDDEHRENEGDLILAAELVTPERIAFMVRHTSGLICLPTTAERLEELDVPMMVMDNTDQIQREVIVVLERLDDLERVQAEDFNALSAKLDEVKALLAK